MTDGAERRTYGLEEATARQDDEGPVSGRVYSMGIAGVWGLVQDKG